MNAIYNLLKENIPHSVICAYFYLQGYKDYHTEDWFVIVPKTHEAQVRNIPEFKKNHKKVMEKTLVRFELRYFLDNIDKYNEVLSDQDGRVFEPKNLDLLITCSKRFKKDHIL